MPPDPDLHPVAALLAPVSDKPPGRSGWRDLGRNLMASSATSALSTPYVVAAVESLLWMLGDALPALAARAALYPFAFLLNLGGAVAKQWLQMLIRGNPDVPAPTPYSPAARKAA